MQATILALLPELIEPLWVVAATLFVIRPGNSLAVLGTPISAYERSHVDQTGTNGRHFPVNGRNA